MKMDRIKIIFVLFTLFLPMVIVPKVYANSEEVVTVQTTEDKQVRVERSQSNQEHYAQSHQEHGADTSILLFIIIAVFVGALTRFWLRNAPLPFTALLLLFGILFGVFTRLGYFEQWGSVDVSFIRDAFHSAAHFDPHLLLYIFLPILVFEAAFGMDLHIFKRSATNAIILAVPGIVVALLLTAVLVYFIDFLNLGLPNWANWSLALMFGSVISATDPVAVVALLKDLGASKKLGTLIEGESLLNDGTAIVIFMVFFGAITGNASEVNGVLQFIIVSFGGIAIGLVIGIIIIKWLMRVFNDAMIEISIVIGAAYLSFYLAEHFFHVSGVLALVTLGIMIGGVGKSSISAKVANFMDEFWELAGFIANSIIFLIVGIIIATRTVFTTNDFLVLFIVYIGIHIVRAVVLLLFYPIMKNTGYGLPVKDAIIVWYGALRGAIGLSMALIVLGIDSEVMAEYMAISVQDAEVVKDQFLFLTAGIVTLTLLINATTIKYLIDYLGLLKTPPAKQIIVYNARLFLRETVEKKMNKLTEDRYLKTANWKLVKDFLPPKPTTNVEEKDIDLLTETRLRLLEHEKSEYWKLFSDGMLSSEAVLFLVEAVNQQLDYGGKRQLSDREDLDHWLKVPRWIELLSQHVTSGFLYQRVLLKRLYLGQEVAIGFIKAQQHSKSILNTMAINENLPHSELKQLEDEYNSNIVQAQVYIRNLRKNYTEIFNQAATIQAIKTILHYEDKTIHKLVNKGQIDTKEESKMRDDLLVRTKKITSNWYSGLKQK